MTREFLQGYALAKKSKGKVQILETPYGLGDFVPVLAEGTTKPRMLKDRFADVINVRDYGAKGDGITDDTEAFKKALFKQKRRVYVPAGKYILNGRIPFESGVRLVGEGISSTEIIFKGSDAGFDIKNKKSCGFSLLKILGTGQTSGYLLDVQNCSGFHADYFRIEAGFNGANFASVNNASMNFFTIADLKGEKAICFCGSDTKKSDVLTLSNGDISHKSNPTIVGISWESYAHSATISNVKFVRGGEGIKISDTSKTGVLAAIPQFARLSNCEFDFCAGRSIELQDVRDVWIDSVYSNSSGDVGIDIGVNAYGVRVMSPRIASSQKAGINLCGKAISIIGGNVYANSKASVGVSDGIYVAASAQDVVLTGCSSGYAWSTSIATQRYGLNIEKGATRVSYVGCDFSGNVTAPVHQTIDSKYESGGSFKHVFTNEKGTHFVIGGSTANSVNYARVSGAPKGSAPKILAEGSDSDIDLSLAPKGLGHVQIGAKFASGTGSVSGYIEVKDVTGTVRKLAVIS